MIFPATTPYTTPGIKNNNVISGTIPAISVEFDDTNEPVSVSAINAFGPIHNATTITTNTNTLNPAYFKAFFSLPVTSAVASYPVSSYGVPSKRGAIYLSVTNVPTTVNNTDDAHKK